MTHEEDPKMAYPEDSEEEEEPNFSCELLVPPDPHPAPGVLRAQGENPRRQTMRISWAMDCPMEQIKLQLRTAIENKDAARATAAIEALERGNVTREALEETFIGLAVNNARKEMAEMWPQLAKRCRALIKCWQGLCEISTRDSMEEAEPIESDEIPNGDKASVLDDANEELDNSLDETPFNNAPIQMVQPSDFMDGDVILDREMDEVREPAMAEMDIVGHMGGIDQPEDAQSEHEDAMADDQIEREEQIDNMSEISTRDSMEEAEPIESDEIPNGDKASVLDDANEELDNSSDETPFNNAAIQMVQPSDFMDGDVILDREMDEVREPAMAEMDIVGHMGGIDQPEDAQSEHEDAMADDQIEREEQIDNMSEISTRDSMEEAEPIETDEIPNGDKASVLDDANEELDNSLDETPFNNAAIQMVQPSDFMDGDVILDREVREPAMAEMDIVGHMGGIDQPEDAQSEHEDAMADDQIEREEQVDNTNGNHKVSSVKEEIELRNKGRPSRRASKSVKNNESLEDSDEDEAPPVKKSKSEANNNKKIVKKRSSSKKSKVVKLNGTDLECPECEYRTSSVAAWRAHLATIHSTTPKKAGFALRCVCGVDGFSDTHFLMCERANAVVIGIEDVKESELVKKNDTELKCPECEHRTRSVMGWVAHLKFIHSTTPNLAGLALRCDCGHEGPSEKHSLTCESNNTIVIDKKDMKKKETPQCILCEAYPATASAYQLHLKRQHKTTLKAQGIYLMCSCNRRMTSNTGSIRIHDKNCGSRQFSLHKLSDD